MARQRTLAVVKQQNGTKDKPRICASLRRAREDQGFTQEALAKKLGCVQVDISRWESYREPNLDTVERWETALGLTRGFILAAAGYGADPRKASAMPLEQAIEFDDRLTGGFRGLLRDSYVNALKRSAAERGEAPAAPSTPKRRRAQ